MHDGDPEPRRRPPRRDPQVLASDVRVVQPQELDREPAELELLAPVGEVLPAVRGEELAQLVRPAAPSLTRLPPVGGDEVSERVQGARCVVVVRAQHEPGGESSACLAHGCHGGFDRLGLGQEVARHDGDVGPRDRGEERALAAIGGDEVQIGQVQDRERLGTVGR